MHPFLFLENSYVPAHVTYTWFVMIVLIAVGFLATRNLQFFPGKVQNFMEVVLEGINRFLVDTMGPKGQQFFPLIATLALFILVSNLIAIVPGFEPPTSNLNTTVALSLIVFIMTHVVGVKEHGFAYIKHFIGPVWWMAPIMFPIEVISHLARPLSLSLRLFGNMFGKELVLIIALIMAPLFVPLPIYVLKVFGGIIQTVVFALLAMMYIGGALEEAH
ncbi:MAG: F0F1 ATP synthase subunit A [Syntrophales bacterium]|jgi:F-type H+-transporting ATPase subunit a|nr:F0F1 ATP synthase subunit A [Syntrophales bacterium]MCK9527803.1 F0F1 ATP synthase subunit A [Syntrophales bacterium]MDX9922100.1 F0F1 ATP synthase subunit A [Syntrophales bacterium]